MGENEKCNEKFVNRRNKNNEIYNERCVYWELEHEKKHYTGEVWIGLNRMAYDFNQFYIQLKWDIVETVREINKIYR